MKVSLINQLHHFASITTLGLAITVLGPVDANAERVLGSPVEPLPREGRLLGSPSQESGGGDPIRPIQQGFDSAAKTKIVQVPPTAPRKPIPKSEIPAPPTANSKPIAVVSPSKASSKATKKPIVIATTTPAPTAPPKPKPKAHSKPKPKPSPKSSGKTVVTEKSEARIKPASTPSWQKLYKLGAGDVINLSLYLRPELARPDVAIAPDGSISYLQAVSIPAEGRTIDQRKWALEHALSEYHKDPKVIITPSAIGSKDFNIIGRVREPGSYPLDRPTTILEGMAMAKGIAVGTINGQLNEIADMNHSFVARNGKKLAVDLGKLYHEGDFSQNAFLEPNDYVYIASSLNQEFYILGYVNNPGRRRMASKTTVARAVAEASGYEKGAWQKQVILVRGSIHNPETSSIDLRAIIKGKAPDIEIEAGDIIYVRERPTRILEEALDEAISTFVQTATAEYITDEVGQ